MKSFIPNLFTLANLASGLFAIIFILSGDYVSGAYFVAASLVLDFLDGFTARLLGVHSDLGVELDSLADVVSFGVVPGFFMYQLFGDALADYGTTNSYLPFLAFLIPLFSAYRLAKFNIDTRQTTAFIGMPTPGNAIWLISWGITALHTANQSVANILLHPVFLVCFIVISSVLLVAELPLISLKVKSAKWQEIKAPVIFLAGSVLLLAIFQLLGFVFIIPLYLLLSLIFKPGRE